MSAIAIAMGMHITNGTAHSSDRPKRDCMASTTGDDGDPKRATE